MADGTTDKNRKEVQGLVCRYWSPGGNVKEHCLNIEGVDDRSAKGIFGFIKKTLDKFGIGMDGLVSHSYDGASVMSGDRNGLKILINEECQRYVLYIHCFLHRVSLVVVHAMENISDIKEYFDIISSLYQFFKKSAVLNMYEGTQLKRLIATRWSGHFDSTNHVNKNYGQILKALHLACKNKKLKSEERALAIGLVNQMGGEGDEVFLFINCLLMEILTPINIVVKTLQSSQENLHSAIQVVNAVREDLKSTRSLLNDVFIEKMISDFKEKNQITVERSKEKRSKSVPAHFQDFVITDPIPADSNYSNNAQTFKECLDLIETEFERRFSNDDVTLWHSMESLSPKFEKFLDADLLNPLFEYAKTIPVIQREYSRLNVSVEDLKGECRIFSRVLKNKEFTKDGNGVVDLVDFASHIIEKYVESAPILCSLYRVAITAGFSAFRIHYFIVVLHTRQNTSFYCCVVYTLEYIILLLCCTHVRIHYFIVVLHTRQNTSFYCCVAYTLEYIILLLCCIHVRIHHFIVVLHTRQNTSFYCCVAYTLEDIILLLCCIHVRIHHFIVVLHTRQKTSFYCCVVYTLEYIILLLCCIHVRRHHVIVVLYTRQNTSFYCCVAYTLEDIILLLCCIHVRRHRFIVVLHTRQNTSFYCCVAHTLEYIILLLCCIHVRIHHFIVVLHTRQNTSFYCCVAYTLEYIILLLCCIHVRIHHFIVVLHTRQNTSFYCCVAYTLEYIILLCCIHVRIHHFIVVLHTRQNTSFYCCVAYT